MRKFTLAVLSITIAAALTGFTIVKPAVKEKEPVRRSCNITATFHNNSSTYTVPAALFAGDPLSDDMATNVAAGNTAALTVTVSSGNVLEFNVQFSGGNPPGVVKVTRTDAFNVVTVVDCDVIARNSNIVTLQIDNSPSCTDTYDFYFIQNGSC